MPRYDRGGTVLKTGQVGYVNVLRQQLLLPGERLRSSVRGDVELTALRERESARIHARIDAFVQPVRWTWPQIVDWLKEGPATTRTWPLVSSVHFLDALGIGGHENPTYGSIPVLRVFEDAPVRIYNEWYKWPEDADITSWHWEGEPAVNLAHSWTRIQAYDGIMSADTELTTTADGSREKFDVRELAELQARFRNAVERDWIAHGRYVDLLRECWNAAGSREVDQVPIRLSGASVGVDPYNIKATDASGLGATATFMDFGVDHHFGEIAVPEHSVVTYMLLLRFSPIAEDEMNPMAMAGDRNWQSLAGDAGMLAADQPEAVRMRNIAVDSGTTVLGYLPAGWQWRARWNLVGHKIDARNSYPLIKSLRGQTASSMRDASRINPAFLSASLGDYKCRLVFDESVDSPIPGPKSSLYAGTGDAGRGSAYPYPGPRRVV